MNALNDKITSTVATLTRELKPEELAVRIAGTTLPSLALGIQHEVSFEAVTELKAGPLPNTALSLGSITELGEQLGRRLHTVREEAGGLIDAWLDEHAAAYQSVLPPQRCLIARPAFGVQQVCSHCGGSQELTCGGCGGNGRVICSACGGRGRVTCASCGGSRQKRCMSCGGAGSHEVREMELTQSDQQNTMNQQRQLVRRVPCSACGGSGSQPCGCDGTQACTCAGGYLTCSGCGGRGKVSCPTCAATGVTHQLGRVQCTVKREIHIAVEGEDEDRLTLRERVPFDGIGALAATSGGVGLRGRNRSGHRAVLDYAASVPVEIAEATHNGRTIAIRAYGPDREIYDYHHLVTGLLESDLAALEQSLDNHAGSLGSTARQLLASEINALIAEATPQDVQTDSAPRIQAISVRLWRTLEQSLRLAPLIRYFRRSGIVIKGLLVLIGFGMVSKPLQSYATLALVGTLFEWRQQRNGSSQAANVANGDAKPAGGNHADVLRRSVEVALVDMAYVRRAGTAIGRAVPLLYGPLVRPMALGVSVSLIVLFPLLAKLLPRWSELDRAAVLVVLSAATWFVIERRAVSLLKTMLGEELFGRLHGRLDAMRDHYRLLVTGCFALAWVLEALVMPDFFYA